MLLLDSIPRDEIDSFLNLKIYSDNIDESYKKYSNAILDICNNEDFSLSNWSLTNYNLKYEDRYIKIIKDFYELNGGDPILMEVGLNYLENLDVLRILGGLDFKDRLLFIDIVRFNKNISDMYSINNIDLLNLFIKLATRELIFPIFHFTKLGITISGGYDLSFSMFFKNKDDLNQYSKIIKDCDYSQNN